MNDVTLAHMDGRHEVHVRFLDCFHDHSQIKFVKQYPLNFGKICFKNAKPTKVEQKGSKDRS